jgi:hypothetical protein
VLPAWITPQWVERVRREFQPYYPSPLIEQDAVEILLSMHHLFRLLDSKEAVDEVPAPIAIAEEVRCAG